MRGERRQLYGRMPVTEYTMIIETGEGNCSAYCPDLPIMAVADDAEEGTVEPMGVGYRKRAVTTTT